MQKIDWDSGEEIAGIPPDPIEKWCEGTNCLNKFLAKWPTARRCDRCRKEKRPYKSEDEPF